MVDDRLCLDELRAPVIFADASVVEVALVRLEHHLELRVSPVLQLLLVVVFRRFSLVAACSVALLSLCVSFACPKADAQTDNAGGTGDFCVDPSARHSHRFAFRNQTRVENLLELPGVLL